MEQQNHEEYVEIDLGRLIQALWSGAGYILLAMLGFGAAALLCAGFVITPVYRACALLYVNNSSISVGSTSISLSDLSASQSLVDTYIVILKSRLTLNEVIERAELTYTYEELYEMVEAEAVDATEVFEVAVESQDPEEAARIANMIVEVLPEKISDIVDGSSVRTVDYAVVPEKRHSPSVFKWTLVGLLLGFVGSCGLIVLRELLDEQVHSESDLLDNYDVPVLAAIPDLTDLKGGKAYGYGSYYAAAGKEGSSI